ncbi:MAG: DUF1097 domain-containing protein [Thermacetogeniaceae bacterium]
MVSLSIIVGVVFGLFCCIFQFFPLSNLGVLWMAFASAALYFNGGGNTKEFPNYALSFIVGCAWGLLYVWGVGFLVKAGLSVPLTLLVDVGVITAVVCLVHFILLAKTWLNHAPSIFLAIALTFSLGGKDLIAEIVTVICGFILVIISLEGNKLFAGLNKKSE